MAMLALTLLTNQVATENAIASARHQVDTQTLNGIERIEMYLQDRRSGVALTAQLPLVRLMLSNQEDPEARERGQSVINAVQSTFNYETLSLLNTAGQTVLSTNPALLGQDRSQRPEVISAQRGALGISDVMADPNEDRVYLHFTAPSYGANNQLIGIVDGRVSLDEIHRLVAMDADRSGKGSYSVIVDAHGIRLSIPGFPHLLFHPSAPLDSTVAQEMIGARRFGRQHCDTRATSLVDARSCRGHRSVEPARRGAPFLPGNAQLWRRRRVSNAQTALGGLVLHSPGAD